MTHESGGALATREGRLVTRAKVVGRVDGTILRVRSDGDDEPVSARLALAGAGEPSAGDSVLLLRGEEGERFVIGVLERRADPSPRNNRVAAANGASAGLVSDQRGERLEVRSPEGRILFEYEPRQGKCSVFSPAGDLELIAPDGSIKLVAGANVRLEARGEASAEGEMGVAFRSGSPGSSERSSLRMVHGRLEVAARSLKVGAADAELALDRARYDGDDLKLSVQAGSIVVATLETVANRIMERAKDVYRRVEGLCDQRAGRARTLVRGSIEMKGEAVYVKGTKSVKINGEKIDLG